MECFWSDYEDARLTDLVFDSNMSTREIALSMGVDELTIKKRIRDLGLSWVRRRGGHASRGQSALTSIMRKLLPGENIVTEEPIGDRLRLDVYCPKYKLAAEYQGSQHFRYVEHFHGDIQGFRDSQRRDERKVELCKDLGIVLIVFRYCDSLNEDSVYERMLEGLLDVPFLQKERKTIRGQPYYEAYKQRQREYRQKSYRRMKQRGPGG